MLGAFSELGWTDVFDIGLVAALIYGGILWLRRSQGSRVALGIGLVAALYLGARLFDLQLTTQAFQSLFAFSIVALVVVFQEELRSGFEELAAWALRRQEVIRPRIDTKDILVASAFELAQQKLGALIVIPGRQLLGRHLQGGVELDGKLSVPLLHSLFDPHSEGHDGAVVVENRRVKRFGAHLPLSRSAAQRRLGTRHSAAIGLTERTDAICLVVSEERGVVSAALNGSLREIRTPEQLGGLLDRFFKERLPLSQRRSRAARLLYENRGPKGVALACSTALWLLLVPGSEPGEARMQLGIQVEGLPLGLELEAVEPPQVAATFLGARRDLFWLRMGDLRVKVDASMASLGRRTFSLSQRHLNHPDEVELLKLEPEKIHISLRPSHTNGDEHSDASD